MLEAPRMKRSRLSFSPTQTTFRNRTPTNPTADGHQFHPVTVANGRINCARLCYLQLVEAKTHRKIRRHPYITFELRAVLLPQSNKSREQPSNTNAQMRGAYAPVPCRRACVGQGRRSQNQGGSHGALPAVDRRRE